MSSGTIGFIGFGTERALEFPDGTVAPVSPLGRCRLRYDATANQIQVSLDGGPYQALITSAMPTVSPWQDDGGGNVRLVNLGNDVAIGAAAVVGAERLRVVGGARVEGEQQVVSLTSLVGSSADLLVGSDSGNVVVTAPGTTGLTVTDGGPVVALRVEPTAGRLRVGPAGPGTNVEIRTQDNDPTAFRAEDGAGLPFFVADTTSGSKQVRIGSADYDVLVDDTHLSLSQLGADPAAVASRVRLYGREVSGSTELFARSSDGTVHQLTPPSAGGSPAGSDTWVQFNDAGSFGASSDFTFDGSNVFLSGTLSVSQILPAFPIPLVLGGSGDTVQFQSDDVVAQGTPVTFSELGGAPGAQPNRSRLYAADVAGVTELFAQSSDGTVHQLTPPPSPGGTPGGVNTNVQFNDAGTFGGSGNFTFDGVNVVIAGTVTTTAVIPNGAPLIVGATGQTLALTGDDIAVNVQASLRQLSTPPPALGGRVRLYGGDVAGTTELFARSSDGTIHQLTPAAGGSPGGANTEVQFNDAGTFGGSPNFTFDGANVFLGGAVFASGLLPNGGAITVGDASQPIFLQGFDVVINEVASLQEQASPPGLTPNRVRLYGFEVGGVTQLFARSSDGTAHQITPPPSPGGTPGGSNTQVQFNDFGSFGGSPNFTFDGTNVEVAGSVTATSLLPNGAPLVVGASTQPVSLQGNDVRFTAGLASLEESALVPASQANTVRMFARDQSGVTQLFARSSDGIIHQLTPNDPASPAGSDTWVQFNDSGSFGASGNFSFDGTNVFVQGFVQATGLQPIGASSLQVGLAGNILILRGSDVYVQQGILTIENSAPPVAFSNRVRLFADEVAGVTELFAIASDGTVSQLTPAGVTTPGGANTQVQFNDGGAFGGNADFTYDGTDVTIANLLNAQEIRIPSPANPAFRITTAAAEYLRFNMVPGQPQVFIGDSAVPGSNGARIGMGILDGFGDAFVVASPTRGYLEVNSGILERMRLSPARMLIQLDVESDAFIIEAGSPATLKMQINASGQSIRFSNNTDNDAILFDTNNFVAFGIPSGQGANTRYYRVPSTPAAEPDAVVVFAEQDALGVPRLLGRTPDGVLHQITPDVVNVSGSRGGNAALASLLAALVSLGLISDSTTP